MIYLTGENVFTFNSGTEFSQFERLELFKRQGKTAKLLLRNYNRLLAKDIATHKLDPTTVLNMYDYFQEAVGLQRKKCPLRLLKSMALKDYHIVGIDNNTSELRYQGNLIGKIAVMPETVGLVGDITYFDRMGHTIFKEYWDWRGFRSMVETYHPDGSIATQQFLKPTGEIALEITHMYLNGKILPTSYKLIAYRGKDYVFDTQDQLYTFFLNEINALEPGVFISDRRTLDNCVLNVINAKQKLAYIHSVPFVDDKKPQKGILPAYRTALTVGNFDQVIFPTKAEANTVSQVFEPKLNVAVAPDSWVKVVTSPKVLPKQKVLIYVGRIAEDKNITDLLKCFKAMYLQDATLRFKLQGYFSNTDYQTKLQQLVSELHLQDAVEFLPYQNEPKLYQDATLFLNASPSEGFGMNMLESMAHGVPIVTYAIDYTENNLVKNDINGYNVKNKTPKLLAKKALELLGDSENYHKLSKGALKTATKYDAKAFSAAWDLVVSE